MRGAMIELNNITFTYIGGTFFQEKDSVIATADCLRGPWSHNNDSRGFSFCAYKPAHIGLPLMKRSGATSYAGGKTGCIRWYGVPGRQSASGGQDLVPENVGRLNR
jgi:hypothetical protein